MIDDDASRCQFVTVDRRTSLARLAPSLTAFAVFLLMAALWVLQCTGCYRHILVVWGVAPFAFPFLDSETVLSGARCLRAGVDIYVANPCDTLGRVYDYSPLWMVIARLPVTRAWGVPAGLLIALLYIGALALLPAARTRRDRLAITLGAVSTVAAFAVERGNNDLILFALAAAAAALACRSRRARLLGYGFALLAGLLKYYPMALLALAAREKPPRLAAIAIAAIGLTALFIALAWHDLARALGLIPTGDYFGGMFGSIQVAGGVQTMLDWPAVAIPLIRWPMIAIALAAGAWWARHDTTAAALATLSMRERAFLLAGGLLTIAAFFTAQNIGYRAIHLLLAMPGLLALRRSGAGLYRRAPALALALLWSDGWRRALLYVAKPFGADMRTSFGLMGWAAREIAWWWLITLLLAAVGGLLWRSTMIGRRTALWARSAR